LLVGDLAHQFVVIDSIEEFFQIKINHPAVAIRDVIEYGNGVRTEYEDDPLTFRLRKLKTTRSSDKALLQDLSYIYDPAGNITQIVGFEAGYLLQ
jgi:hypothetical protein